MKKASSHGSHGKKETRIFFFKNLRLQLKANFSKNKAEAECGNFLIKVGDLAGGHGLVTMHECRF